MNKLMHRNRLFDSDMWDFPTLWSGLGQRDGLQPVNIRDTGKTFEVDVALPGYHKEDLKVSLDDGMLNIACDRTDESEENDEGYSRREFRSSSFRRSFQLPASANEADLKARYTDGVLHVSIGKRKEAATHKPRHVAIE
jgi:HSP20 family protein